MRPIHLTMEAFGSYGQRAEIDFTKPVQNLFLVTGDTGAGKSTIFDAMVFALYGEASSESNKKDGTELQSQFGIYDRTPFVELTFTEESGSQTKTYSVRRTPRHFRMKKGKIPQLKGTPEAETVELTMPDGSIYPTKETNAELVSIIGLTKSQFMQVGMIAQGEFMALLRAKTNDKKVIFRRLFHTELYVKITEELDRRRKDKEKEIGEIRTRCQNEIGHVEIPADYEKAGQMEEEKRQIQTASRLNVAMMEAFLQELQELCLVLRQQQEEAADLQEKLGQIRDEKQTAVTQGRELAEVFDKLEAACRQLKECQEDQERIDDTLRLAGEITAAYEIAPVHTRFADAEKITRKTAEDLKKQEEALPGLQEKQKDTEEAYQRVQTAYTKERESFALVEERVKKAKELFAEIRIAEGAESKSLKALNAAEKAAKKAADDLEEQERQEGLWKQESVDLANAGVELQKWQSQKQILDSLQEELDAVSLQEGEVKAQEKKARAAGKKYSDARRDYQEKNNEYQKKRMAFLDEQAGFLAAELKPGCPCPVCGSREHPAPCRKQDLLQDLNRELIEEMAQEVDRLNTAMTEAATRSGAAADLLEEKRKNLEEAKQRLCSHMKKDLKLLPEELSPEGAARILQEGRQALEEQRQQLENNAARLEEVQGLLKDADSRKQELRRLSQEAGETLTRAKTDQAQAKTALEGLQKQRDFADEKEAQKVFLEAKTILDQKESSCQGAKAAAQKARKAAENCQTLIGDYQAKAPEQIRHQEECRKAYLQVMEEKDLSEADWQALTLQYEKEEADRLRKLAEEHKEKKTAAIAAIKAHEATIAGREKPNREQLEKAFSEAEENWKGAREKQNRIRTQLQQDQDVCDRLLPQMEARAQATNEYDRINRLWTALAGKLTGARMDIETYVQRYYLEQILHSANARFDEMTAGQYELRMVDDGKAGAGTNRGLDLMVYSNITGKEREIRTLSGGESFMAALSLALGMSDQIQAASAALHLDVLFIDEGFGSLDDNSRNQAVRVLQQMAGKDRLVGIISHVTELKTQIDDQLVVTKDDQGSHVRWND